MMASRGRGYNSQDWDPMRDDYDNSAYDRQYPDESSSGLVNLDHCRLYITNIPKALNQEGIHTLFSKFGILTESFVSSNPEKRYGLVAFETPGEAKLAMMKLNRTEPLRLNISIAHKPKKARDNRERDQVSSGQRDRDTRSYREDNSSVGSRNSNRKPEEQANGEIMEDLVEDDIMGLNNSLDPDTSLELENLRLEHLKLQEAQVLCKHRMLLLKQAEKKSSATSRCILPNGRIVVRNVDKAEGRDAEASYGAGAGDSRVANCVACGGAASLFCGGCGITPYCSAGCQRRDYAERHRQVCHNLKRSVNGGSAVTPRAELQLQPLVPAAAPLRRPRSPDSVKRERRDEDSVSDRAPQHKFGPPGSITNGNTATTSNYNSRAARPNQPDRAGPSQGDVAQNRDERPRYGNRSGQDDRTGRQARPDDARSGGRSGQDGRTNDRNDNRGRPGRNDNRSARLGRPGDRQPDARRAPQEDDEEWGAKAEASQPTPKPKSPSAQLVEPKLQPKLAQTAAEVATVNATPAVASSSELVPKNCLIDLLSVNDSFSLSVDASGAECRAGAGFVCLALHERHSEQYMQLLDDSFTARCEASPECTPQPGETFAYRNPEDEAWYRARRVLADGAALLDAGRLAPLAGGRCARLPPDYAELPEFSCLLTATDVQINDKLTCTVVSKSGSTLNVTLVDLETGAAHGSGAVRRWLPAVDRPAPARGPPAAPAGPSGATGAAAADIPEVPRPPLADKSRVLLVDASAPGRLFVRGARRDQRAEFDQVVMEGAEYGLNATPLKEPPAIGQTVVAKFTDGTHYRALCRRVNSKLNKYLLEYIEYGNTAVAFLQELYPCPPELALGARPTRTSQAQLLMDRKFFTAAAAEYLEKLKDDAVELILSIPTGAATVASGGAVKLTVAETGEDVNRTVSALCTPDWQKLMERGGDVLDVEALGYSDVENVDLPTAGCELQVCDTSALKSGVITGHERGAPHAARAFALADQLEEYCNSALCQDPYLPKLEELCVAYCPIRKQWLRATLLEQSQGAGGAEAQVLFLDYGHFASVPVGRLRKMMPEFVRGLPVAACSLEILGFPKTVTDEQVALAKQHMKINDQGFGTLRVSRCQKTDLSEYVVEAPELIRAMEL